MSSVISWLQNHPVTVLLVWQALSAALSAVYRGLTPAQLASIKARIPWLVALIGIAEAVGLDLPKLLRILQQVVSPADEKSKQTKQGEGR